MRSLTTDEVSMERTKLLKALCQCLADPSSTWLTPEIIRQINIAESGASDDCTFEEDSMRDLISIMISTRDELEAIAKAEAFIGTDDKDYNENFVIQEGISQIQTMVEAIVSTAEVGAGKEAAKNLRSSLTSELCSDGKIVVEHTENSKVNKINEKTKKDQFVTSDLLKIELDTEEATTMIECNVLTELTDDSMIPDNLYDSSYNEDVVVVDSDVVTDMIRSDKNNVGSKSMKNKKNINKAFFDVDVTEVDIQTTTSKQWNGNEEDTIEITTSTPVIEIIQADNDIDDIRLNKLESNNANEHLQEGVRSSYEDNDKTHSLEDKNVFGDLALRSLDITFFLAEKTLTVGIPTVVDTARQLQSRIDTVEREGLGSKGWKLLGNVKGGKQRY